MNWLSLYTLVGALLGWTFGGLFWLSWLTDRHSAAGGVNWWPSIWQVIVAGPGAWLTCLIGRIVR